MENYGFCPYCFEPIEELPHADHIYPVSLGRLSIPTNMVMICSRCNLKKSDKTLNEFILENNLQRDRIEELLKIMGKKF